MNVAEHIKATPDDMWSFLPPVPGIPPMHFLVHVSIHASGVEEDGAATKIMQWWMDYWKRAVVVIASRREHGAILRLDFDGDNVLQVEAVSKLIDKDLLTKIGARMAYYDVPLATDMPTWGGHDGWRGWDVWDMGRQVRESAMSADPQLKGWQFDAIWEWLHNANWRTQNFINDRKVKIINLEDGNRKVLVT